MVSKGICPKVNVKARLGFELAYYDSAVRRFNHYTTRGPLPFLRFMGGASDNHVTVGHETFREASSTIF